MCIKRDTHLEYVQTDLGRVVYIDGRRIGTVVRCPDLCRDGWLFMPVGGGAFFGKTADAAVLNYLVALFVG